MTSTTGSIAADRVFGDTWAWLVLANDRDPAFHSVWRLRAAAQPGAWLTTDYVLDETMTRLFATGPFPLARRFMEGVFEASRLGLVGIEHVTPDRFTRAWRLRLRYHDKPRISFTGLTSFVVMRELQVRHALTADAHFEQAGLGLVRLP